MTVKNTLYSPFAENLLEANISDLSVDGNDIKVALMHSDGAKVAGSGFTFDQNHDNWGQVSNNEVLDTDYAAQNLPGKGIDRATRVTSFSATKTSFGSTVTIAATHAVIYDDEPVADADKKLIACIDFGGEEASEDGKFELKWDSSETSGDILTLTVAAEA